MDEKQRRSGDNDENDDSALEWRSGSGSGSGWKGGVNRDDEIAGGGKQGGAGGS